MMSHSAQDPGSASEMERWIACARQGSREALGNALEACRLYLLKVAQADFPEVLRGKERPSDLVQRTLVNAVNKFDQFEGTTEKELLAWLTRILINVRINLTKSYGRESRLVVPLEPGAASESKDPLPGPEEQAGRQEQDEELARALAQLSEEERRVIHLRDWEGLDWSTVARLLGKPSPDAARKLYTRAIDRLGEILESGDAQQRR